MWHETISHLPPLGKWVLVKPKCFEPKDGSPQKPSGAVLVHKFPEHPDMGVEWLVYGLIHMDLTMCPEWAEDEDDERG